MYLAEQIAVFATVEKLFIFVLTLWMSTHIAHKLLNGGGGIRKTQM